MIVTRDEVKTFLQITGISKDALIDALIIEAESLFLQKREIDFFSFTGNTESLSDIITNIDDDNDFIYIKTGKIIESTLYGIRERITSFDSDNLEIQVENNITASNDDIEFVIYPYGSQIIAARIVGYLMSKDSLNGLQSESIGNYSYTKFDNSTGLPLDLIKNIQVYQTSWR